MKQTITEKDIERLVGKFIIEIDSDNPIRLNQKGVDLGFYFEKRIKFVAFSKDGVMLSSLYGNTIEHTTERFVSYFNDYLGEPKGRRFHRLLFHDELAILFKFLLERNY